MVVSCIAKRERGGLGMVLGGGRILLFVFSTFATAHLVVRGKLERVKGE